jgi:hypothetical protein
MLCPLDVEWWFAALGSMRILLGRDECGWATIQFFPADGRKYRRLKAKVRDAMKKIAVERVMFVSRRLVEEVMRRLEKGIGRPNFGELSRRVNVAATLAEHESIVHGAGEPSAAHDINKSRAFDYSQPPPSAAYSSTRD